MLFTRRIWPAVGWRWGAGLLLLALVVTGWKVMTGRARQDVEAISWTLLNRVVVVDPGHGGVDPGAVGPGGTLEKDLTLAIGRRVARHLRQAGAVVVMTREDDRDLSKPGKSLAARKREDLELRVQLARESKAEVYLGIQANAFGTRWTGAQTFYHPRSPDSKRLANAIQNEIRHLLQNTHRQAKELDPYVLRNLDIPGVLVEVGFLSNAGEEKLLNDPVYQERLAYAIYAGVARYLAEEPRAR